MYIYNQNICLFSSPSAHMSWDYAVEKWMVTLNALLQNHTLLRWVLILFMSQLIAVTILFLVCPGCHLYTTACCHHWPDTFIFHPKHWHAQGLKGNPYHWPAMKKGYPYSWPQPWCKQRYPNHWPGNSVHSAIHSKFTLNKTLMSLSTVLSVRSTLAEPVRIYCTSVDC